MRIELDGPEVWAELRHANKIPHGKTMEYRRTFYKVVAMGAGGEDATATSTAIIENGGLEAMEELANALVLAVVQDWSYGPVDLDTLLNVPTAELDEIQRRCASDAYTKVLQPDFDVNPDPDSPTKPSDS